MASMREFVEGSLGVADGGRMRSLGSELGSELGDWGSPIPQTHVSDNRSPSGYMTRTDMNAEEVTDSPSQDIDLLSVDDDSDEAAWEDEPDTLFSVDGDFNEGDTTIFNSPAVLPPLVSAALSSLAAALAPTQSWGSSPVSGEEQAGPSHSRLSSSTSQDTVIERSASESCIIATAVPHAASRIQAGVDQPVFRSGHVRRQSSPSPMSSQPGDESLILHPGSVEPSNSSGPSTISSHPAPHQSGPSRRPDKLHGSQNGKGKAREIVNHRPAVLPRPKVERSSSSQSSIALAHRRVSGTITNITPTTVFSQDGQGGSDGRRGDTDIDSPTTPLEAPIATDEVDSEPKSIPAKLIHDLIVWLVITLQFFEWIVILGIRVRVDLQNGRSGLM